MPKYHVIVEDNQCYDFTLDVPEGLTEEERDEFIMDYLSDNRDEAWRSGQENIVAIDPL